MTAISRTLRALFFVLFLPCLAGAQTTDTILSGRPGIFIPPYVVGTGVAQLQSGIDYLKSEDDFFTETTQSNNFFRLGFNEWFEANLLLNYQSDFVSNPNFENTRGLSQVVPGARINLINEESGWIQGFGIQLDFSLKDVGTDYKSFHNTPGITFVSYHQLTHDYSLSFNLGSTYNSFQGFEVFYRGAIGFPLPFELDGFFELYGFEGEIDNSSRQYLDTGFGYIITKDIQFDLSAGYGKNYGVAETFVSTGLSLRTDAF